MIASPWPNFDRHTLSDGALFFAGRLPEPLACADAQFDALWQIRPDHFHQIKMFGRLVKTPRWQQAYGEDYHYTGRVNRALPIPAGIQPLVDWTREQIDTRLNGVLVNWYDGVLGHYMGPHHDSTANMVSGAPIVTISLGEERIFRLTQRKAQKQDFVAAAGDVFVMPWETNLVWKHGVPHFKRYSGRRISVTVRAFGDRTEPSRS